VTDDENGKDENSGITCGNEMNVKQTDKDGAEELKRELTSKIA